MIYSRLLLARNLLTAEGVIFISIDDHEQANLKKIADEVFGASNFIAQIVWERAFSPVNLKKHFSESHDYILCYAKSIDRAVCNGLPRSSESDSRYANPDHDERGPWISGDLSVGPAVESKIYEIVTPSGRKVLPSSGYCWRLDKKTFEQYVAENRIWFGEDGNNVPRIKRFLSDVKQGITPTTVWKFTEVGHSQDAKQKLKKLFDGKSYFDYPKSVELLKRCIRLYGDENAIVLDFFSGSATTAQAVMEVNAEDGTNKKFIMIQLQEECAQKTEAFKDGYKTICDIGKERIRRSAKKIAEEHPNADPDTGFRVFELAESNRKDVYFAPEEMEQSMLAMLESNIREDRTDMDLLFGCLLDWGLPLSLPHTSERIEGFTVHNYNDGDLVACFDEKIPDSVMKAIAGMKPLRAVFRDSSFADSPSKINVGEIFKRMAPDTVVKVI
jgi:adenine-specific DNA-methyltransferase